MDEKHILVIDRLTDGDAFVLAVGNAFAVGILYGSKVPNSLSITDWHNHRLEKMRIESGVGVLANVSGAVRVFRCRCPAFPQKWLSALPSPWTFKCM